MGHRHSIDFFKVLFVYSYHFSFVYILPELFSFQIMADNDH